MYRRGATNDESRGAPSTNTSTAHGALLRERSRHHDGTLKT